MTTRTTACGILGGERPHNHSSPMLKPSPLSRPPSKGRLDLPPPETIERPPASQPIHPEAVDGLPGVLGHFQYCGEMRTIHASNAHAEQMAACTELALKFGVELADSGGLGDFYMIQAIAADEELFFFSVDAPRANPPGIRSVGVLTKPRIDADNLVQTIRTVTEL